MSDHPITPKALLWDMDGTLLDSEPTSAVVLAGALTEAGLSHDDELLESVVGVAANDIYDRLCAERGLKIPFVEWEALKAKVYLDSVHAIPVFEEAHAVWQALHDRGVRQAVVSNADRIYLDANLRRVGLPYAGFVSVSRNDVLEGKPSPEPYLRGAHLLGVSPAETLVIEDSHVGLRAGVDAGMRAYVVPWAADGVGDAQHRLSQMTDLVAMFD